MAGRYTPAIGAIKAFLGLDFSVMPGLIALGLGVIAGIGLSIHAIRAALRKYRSQMDWLILGLMAGSLYAIVMGPAGLDAPQPPVSLQSFDWLGFILGICLLLGLEALRRAQTPGSAKRELRAEIASLWHGLTVRLIRCSKSATAAQHFLLLLQKKTLARQK